MVISIDHGNRQIKTIHKTFVSGLVETDVRPALGEEFIQYNGHYYSLTERRLAYRRDKSRDESFFILTLFGISYEILAAGAYSTTEPISIDLLIGLPPAHFGAQYRDFERYFQRGLVQYQFAGKPFSVYFNTVTAYPQAYAAAMTVFGQIRPLAKCIVIDIGGFTTDYMMMKFGVPDMASCNSLEHGVIVLYNRIIHAVNSAHDLLLDEFDIDSTLNGQNHSLPDAVQRTIQTQAQAFVEELLGQLRERMIDLRVTKPVFVGGGSLLLRHYLEHSDKLGESLFVEDLHANAKGYERIHQAQRVHKGQG